MKRIIPVFVLTLIATLATGPALAEAICALDNSATAGSSCPMKMADVSADCPLSHDLMTRDCSQDCCNRNLPDASVAPPSSSKPKLGAPAAGLQSPVALATSPSPAKFRQEPSLFAPSLARHVLIRVFRI